MKHRFLSRQFFIPLAFALAVCIHPAFALALMFAGGAALGTSYNIMTPQTSSGIVALAPNDREQAWAKKIILGAFNLNVFADYHIGPPGSKKAFIEYVDTRRIRGNTITLTDVSQLGSSGAQGETQRNGLEEKINPHEQALTVGRQWYGMGVTTVAQAETIVGSEWDNLNSPLLEQRVGLKKSNDMQMVLREGATSDNRVYPNGKTLATLKSADVFQTSVITKASVRLSGNGAVPTVLGKDPERGVVEAYTFTGALDSFTSLYQDPTYQSVVNQGSVRGDNNIISGKFSDWNGNMIYPLQLRRFGGKGSIGSPLLRQAFLGIAIAANDTGVNSGVITGGGLGYASANDYFEHFSGFAYKLTNGNSPNLTAGAQTAQAGSTLTGDGSGPWYVAMVDKTTGNYALFSYTGNTGPTLTGVKRLGATTTSNMITTLSGSTVMAYSTATYNAATNPITTAAGGGALGLIVAATAVAQGSPIVEINAVGVPFADTLGLGEMAGVMGYGFVPGTSTFFGRRTKQIGNHELDVAVGYEFAFGCRAYYNVDNIPTNFVRITHAISIDGLPIVATP